MFVKKSDWGWTDNACFRAVARLHVFAQFSLSARQIEWKKGKTINSFFHNDCMAPFAILCSKRFVFFTRCFNWRLWEYAKNSMNKFRAKENSQDFVDHEGRPQIIGTEIEVAPKGVIWGRLEIWWPFLVKYEEGTKKSIWRLIFEIDCYQECIKSLPVWLWELIWSLSNWTYTGFN